jgi:hypothetical protein
MLEFGLATELLLASVWGWGRKWRIVEQSCLFSVINGGMICGYFSFTNMEICAHYLILYFPTLFFYIISSGNLSNTEIKVFQIFKNTKALAISFFYAVFNSKL